MVKSQRDGHIFIILHQSRCPATWKTWKCQGIPTKGEKVRELEKKNKKSQGILLCEAHCLGHISEFHRSLEKSGNSIPSVEWTP